MLHLPDSASSLFAASNLCARISFSSRGPRRLDGLATNGSERQKKQRTISGIGRPSIWKGHPIMSVTTAPDPPRLLETPAGASRGLLWSEAIRAFVFDLKKRGYSVLTLRDYKSDIAQLSTLTRITPTQLGEPVIEDVLNTLQKAGFGAAVLRRKRAAHHSFLQFIRERNRPEPLAITLWKRAAEEPPADRVLLGLIMVAGARLIEIPSMEGRDIRLRSNTIRIRHGLRILPIHPALRELFSEARSEVPLVPFRPLLPGMNGFPVNARTMHARFRRLARRLGFPALRPDEVRRDVAAHLVASGTPHGLVAAFLARDRGRPVAPRRGGYLDLTCLEPRLALLALPHGDGGTSS
jgi:integrase